jgi:hypothetical protein
MKNITTEMSNNIILYISKRPGSGENHHQPYYGEFFKIRRPISLLQNEIVQRIGRLNYAYRETYRPSYQTAFIFGYKLGKLTTI